MFLTLHPIAIEEIERYGIVHVDSYPKGYWFDESCHLIELLPNYSFINNERPCWQTFQDNQICSISVVTKSLLVTHGNLITLHQRIEAKLSSDTNPENLEQNLHNISIGRVNKNFRPLVNIANEISDCSPNDLLRRAIQKKLTLLVPTSTLTDIRSTSEKDYLSGVEYLLQPKFLELNPLNCEDIYIDGNVAISDFVAGYIIDYMGRTKRVTPAYERPWLIDEKVSWRTYFGHECIPLNISCKYLYALQSDVCELVDEDETQEFQIPKEITSLLLCNNFVSLTQAVEIAKLKHPKCTTNNFFRLGHNRKVAIVTPIPIAIKVNKFSVRPEKKISFYSLDEYPVLLQLETDTCADLENHGKAETDSFSSDYWTYDSQFQRKSATGKNIWGLATYFKNKPHKIELSSDRLYIDKSALLQIVDSSSDLWSSIDKIPLEEAGERRLESEVLDLNKYNTLAKSLAKSMSVDFEGLSTDKNQDPTNRERLDVDLVDQPSYQQERTENTEEIPDSPSASIKFLSKIEVMKLLNIGKSTIHNRINPRHKNYDSAFPLPIGGRNQEKRWVETEIEAYQKLLMNRRTPSGQVD